MFKKEKSYLAWYHPTTSQCTCRLTWNTAWRLRGLV